MKRQILFIINNLNCGGAEKALISLLETIDYSKYDVDLFLFKHEGIFMAQVPIKVNLLDEVENYKYFDMSIKVAIKDLIKLGKIDIAFSRILSGYIFKTQKCGSRVEQKNWRYVSKIFPPIRKNYDVAIGYLEKGPVYFCVDKVNAKKKIGWIHNDYEKLGMVKEIDNKYFKKLDYIFTVSEECLQVLNKIFPQFKEKFKLMHNIVSEETINKLALKEINDIEIYKDDINIISVGRLNYQKAFELSIEACDILIRKGYRIKWMIVGEGEERQNLQKLIDSLNISDNFKLIGIRENPYPYVKNSDIYVQSSKFEGKSIAIDEAKILLKPIVITNFSTAKDQIENGINGLISNMDSNSLANEIERLLIDIDLRNVLIKNLANESLGNEKEIEKLLEVF